MSTMSNSPRDQHESARNQYREVIVNEIDAAEGDIGYAIAIGSPSWEEFNRVGQLEAALLVQYGLLGCETIVDVGCGSGRLAFSLPKLFRGNYIGTDISEPLLRRAAQSLKSPHFRFLLVDDLVIPVEDDSVAMVSMFSLLTHLRHEESFLYLREAKRVMRSGSTLVFSFLDFSQESHWSIFEETVEAVSSRSLHHVNQFMSRDLVAAWAKMLEFEMVDLHDGQGKFIEYCGPDGAVSLESIGQSVAVWRKTC